MRITSSSVLGGWLERSRMLEACFISRALRAGSLLMSCFSRTTETFGSARARRMSRVIIGRLGSCSSPFINWVTTLR
ncbi:hypothetical protein D3C80_1605740 [compost metagenome]